jgi:hypothetical protein
VQSFRINLWDNLKATNRCGQCHVAGKQSPEFARQDDINLAYQAANTVVNLSSPKDSRMVAKVGGGHNCWLASDDACAEILTTWISNWAGASQAGRQCRARGADAQDPVRQGLPGGPGAVLDDHPVLEEYCRAVIRRRPRPRISRRIRVVRRR